MEMWYGYNIQKDARESPRPPLGGLFHSARCARLRSTTRQGAAPRKQTAQMINQTRKTTYKGWPDLGGPTLGKSVSEKCPITRSRRRKEADFRREWACVRLLTSSATSDWAFFRHALT